MMFPTNKVFFTCILACSTIATATEPEMTTTSPAAVQGNIELGVLYPISHKVQFSKNTTRFDYVDEGGQDNLFTFARFAMSRTFENGDRLRFIFQPLEIEAKVLLQDDISIDGIGFAKGTALRTLYSFPFYRLSYFWDTWQTHDQSLHLGLGLQIRNAKIEFESLDGEVFVSNRDIGPVPLLSLAYEWKTTEQQFLALEAEGLFAPGKYINGDSESEVEGAILDTSIRYGISATPQHRFYANLRYLGGGAEGTSDSSTPPGDGFNSNWLHFATLSLGAEATL